MYKLTDLVNESDGVVLAANHAVIHDSVGLIRDEEAGTSDTEFVWTLRADLHPIEDDPRTVRDFPLIQLAPFWTHPDPPITRMNQRELVDTLFGMEWLLVSDIYQTHRTEEFFDQYMDMLELVRSRSYYLYSHESSSVVLNVLRYTDTIYETKPAVCEDADYESDDELRFTRKRIKWDDAEEIDREAVLPVKCNDLYVHDVNTATRAIDDALYTRRMYKDLEDVPKIPLNRLRNRLFEEAKDVREASVVTFRREFYQKMVTTASYRRVHKRANPFDKRPAARAVLVKKNEMLGSICVPTSFLDMVTPKASTTPNEIVAADMRMDGDAMLFFSSAAVPNGDYVSSIWIGDLDWRMEIKDFPKIGRLAAEQKFVVFCPNGEKRLATSFCAAFAYLRTAYKTKNPNESRYDSYFTT